MHPKVLVVILNYRTAGLTCDCLDSLAEERAGSVPFDVTVVDNHSNDGSAERLQAHVTQKGWNWVHIDARQVNDGFAAGNNAAIRPALASGDVPDFFWLLNPDTVVRPGALSECIAFLQQHPQVGIAGSRLEDPDGTPQRSAFRFPGILSEFERALRLGFVSRLLSRRLVAPPVRDEAHRVDWLAGASMLVRRAVFDSVGLMDDGYFLYFEETDFFWRTQRVGWESWYVPSSRVVHLVGQSTGVGTGKKVKRVPAYWFDSRRRYFQKNYGVLHAKLCDLSWLLGHALWRVRRCLERRPDDDPPHLVRDFLQRNFLKFQATR